MSQKNVRTPADGGLWEVPPEGPPEGSKEAPLEDPAQVATGGEYYAMCFLLAHKKYIKRKPQN